MTRRLILLAVALAATMALAGCSDDDDVYRSDVDLQAPATPRGVYSITGDERVTIVWLGSDEQDLEGYAVYRSRDLDGPYHEIGEVLVDDLPLRLEFVDRNVTNGQTYYYAVSSFDYAGNLSELSYEDVFDTPRPAGYGVRLYAIDARISQSAFDFSRYSVTSGDDPAADILISRDGDALYLEAVDHPDVLTDIQDFGYTTDLDVLDWAPPEGWSPNGWSELILGHTYAIWTRDDHYAKIRVTRVTNDYIEMDWAYQIDPGNPELKPAIPRDSTNAIATTARNEREQG
ncbi:MAG: hypothetical protein GF341_03075 [candidate division Zixibacteria bacterium]|nr:hypothetical protein [candidate division Zixibacteria bacterium]